MPLAQLNGLHGTPALEGRVGPHVPYGTPVNLPAELGNDLIRLTFEADASTWCKLATLAHLEGDDPFTFENLPMGDLDARLWELRGTLESGTAWSLAPHQVGGFDVRSTTDTAGNPALLLLWTGCIVPGSSGDVLTVAVLVSLAAGDQVSRWTGFVDRVAGSTETASVDEFDLGIVCWKSPIATQGAETNIEASARAFYTHCVNHSDATPLFSGGNNPLRRWALGVGYTLSHPSGGDQAPNIYSQQLQFNSLGCADSADTASFRRILYMGTEDSRGYYKEFVHRGRNDGTNAAMEWRATFFPSFAKLPSGSDAFPHSEFGNVCRTAYPVAIGALLSPHDALWLHACQFYRETVVERLGLGGLPRELRTDNSPLHREGIMHGEISFLGDVVGMFSRWVELTQIVEAILANPHVSHPLFQMWTVWVQGQQSIEESPADPVTPDPLVPPAIAAGEALGFMTFLYTQTRRIQRDVGWEAHLVDKGEVHRRDGTVHPTYLYADYATPEGRAMPLELVRQVQASTGCQGIYSDGLLGGHSAVVYDPTDPAERGHPSHGGRYWTDGRTTFARAVRAMIEAASGSACLVSETAEEGSAMQAFDLTQEGLVPPGGHLLLAAEALYTYSMTGVPAAARDVSPPLWQAVYHRWHCTGRFVTTLTDVGLATNATFYPDGLFAGMTADEWIDWQTYWWLLTWITGNKPLFLSHWGAGPIDRPSVTLDDLGNLETADPAADPADTGLTVVEFIRHLMAGWKLEHAGRFLVYGHLEAPLEVDYTDPLNDVVVNPTAVCQTKTTEADGQWTRPAYYNTDSATTDAVLSPDFDVPKVHHAVWRGQNGEVGIILGNWTGAAATFKGELDPEAYGITGEYSLRLVVTDVDTDAGQLDFSDPLQSGLLAAV